VAGELLNTITVSINPTTDLVSNNVVTIMGLTNAIAEGETSATVTTITLLYGCTSAANVFSNSAGGSPSKGDWTPDTLTLTVREGITAAVGVEFSFKVRNPASAQSTATPSIEASDTASFSKTVMTQPNLPVFGVSGGANPLQIVVPAFTTMITGQSTPVAGSTNTMTVVLRPNEDELLA
jgi:hypothetical protein